MNPKGINFLLRGRRGAEVCREVRQWSPVPLVGARSSLHTTLELGAPCLELGLDPMEQSLPLPGPLILELSDPPTLGWAAEVKKGSLGVLPPQEVNTWTNAPGIPLQFFHGFPKERAKHLWGSQKF